jgi:hypothetical protein
MTDVDDDKPRERPRPRVKLVGEDGSAFAVLGACIRAARAAGWTQGELDRFREAATSGDYNHLLGVVMEHFEVE